MLIYPSNNKCKTVLTDNSLDPKRTHIVASTVTAQLGTLADLKIYVGMHSGDGGSGFVWLVTNVHSLFRVVANYSTDTVLVVGRRQSLLTSGSVGPRGVYQPAPPPPSQG